MDNLIHRIANIINNKSERTIVGISGHGAAGKTVFANRLKELLGQKRVNVMNTDPYIIPSSTIRKYAVIDYIYKNENHRYKMTACHPGAHHIGALERDIQMLKEGLGVYTLASFDGKSRFITPEKEITIIEGMSVAFTNPVLFDMKIYLYTDENTELTRRSGRDVQERGTSLDYLLKSHEERRIQYELFMHPYHRNFDIVIRNSNDDFVVEKNIYE